MTAWRALRLADAFNPLCLKELVPFLKIPHVERNVREPDTVPGYRARRDLRLQGKNLEPGAPRHADPSNLAAAAFGIDAKKRAHAIRRRVSHPDERAAEDLPVKLHR